MTVGRSSSTRDSPVRYHSFTAGLVDDYVDARRLHVRRRGTNAHVSRCTGPGRAPRGTGHASQLQRHHRRDDALRRRVLRPRQRVLPPGRPARREILRGRHGEKHGSGLGVCPDRHSTDRGRRHARPAAVDPQLPRRDGGIEFTDGSWTRGSYGPLDTTLVEASARAAERVVDGPEYHRIGTGGGDAKVRRHDGVPGLEFGVGTQTTHGTEEYMPTHGLVRNATASALPPVEYVRSIDDATGSRLAWTPVGGPPGVRATVGASTRQ